MSFADDKQTVVDALLEQLRVDLQRMVAGQKATQDGATHAEAKQENDKDTRAIEAQYLARGLGMRVEQLRDDIARIEAMPLRVFDDETPIALSALVDVEDADAEAVETYFLVPVGGGVKLDIGGRTVVVITPASPVGRALVGKMLDDDVTVATPSGPREATVVEVS